MDGSDSTDPGGAGAPPGHDVIVLGGHLATALVAAALARTGVRVAIVRTRGDRTTPAGETTIPYTAEMFFLLATRLDLPEVWDLGMFDRLPESVRATSGIKRSLGFLYHRSGQAHRPREALQFNVPREHAEWHPYRPDVDRYAEHLAVRYGATLVADHPARVHVEPDGVRVEFDRGRATLHGQLLVDGSGDPALLPAGVRGPDPARTRHRARLLTARLPAVRPFESVVPVRRYGRKCSPWSQGTLLHVFDGGWIQLAGFGDHDAGTKPHVSVVASLDPDRHPHHGGSPEAEFADLVASYPQLAAQFSGLVGAGEWQRHETWPALAADCVGPRWFLFDRAAGRHDFLFSRDLSTSLELTHALAAALLRVCRTRDWAGDGLREVADFQLGLFGFHDRMVAAARTASGDFALWNAFLRVWLLWSIVSTMSLRRARLDGPDSDWASVDALDQGAFWYRVPDGLPDLVADVLTDVEQVAAGAQPARSVARVVFERLRAAPFVPPLYDFGDPDARYYTFTRTRRFRTLFWSRLTAPAEFRSLFLRNNVTGTPEAPSTR